MDSEVSQLGNLISNLEETETDSPPPAKVHRGTGSTSFGKGALFDGSYVFLRDPLNDNNLQHIPVGKAISLEISSNITSNPERDVTQNENIEQLNGSITGGERSDEQSENFSDLGQSQEESIQGGEVAPIQVTINNEENEESLQSNVKTAGFYKVVNEILQKRNLVSLNFNLGLCYEVTELLAKDQEKTKDMLLQEYFSCPTRFQKVTDVVSYIRQDINEFLQSSGENQLNSVGSARLKAEMEKPDYGLLYLLAEIVKFVDSRLESIDNRPNNDNSVPDVVCGPSSSLTPVVLENVQAADTANEVRMEEDQGADEPIDISFEFMPVAFSPSRPPNVENTSYWKESITNMLFSSLYLDIRAVLLTQEQKISRMGKRLFTTLFTEQEIVGGFARAKRNIPAYDGNRVFEISQIINFMLTQNHHNENFLEEFRCGQYKNTGLEKDNYKLFWSNIMIKFASDERKRIKTGQS